MTPADIITRLFSEKGVTKARVVKAQGLAIRSRIEWSAVLDAMTEDQRKVVSDAR